MSMPEVSAAGTASEAIPCRLCGSGRTRPHVEKDPHRILRCAGCGVAFLEDQPSEGDLRSLYDEGYFRAAADGRGYEDYPGCRPALVRTFRKRMRRLLPHVGSGRVLDLGCAHGYFLEALPRSFSGVGVDISAHAVGEGRRRGLDVRQGPLGEGMFEEGSFALATMWDTIEHLRDPERTLALLHRAVEPGGILALTTGNVDSLAARISGRRWHLYTLPEHLWFFSPGSLSRLLETSGFQVLEVRREWGRYTMAYLLERGFKVFLDSPEAARRMPLRRPLQRFAVPFTLFDILFAVARRCTRPARP